MSFHLGESESQSQSAARSISVDAAPFLQDASERTKLGHILYGFYPGFSPEPDTHVVSQGGSIVAPPGYPSPEADFLASALTAVENIILAAFLLRPPLLLQVTDWMTGITSESLVFASADGWHGRIRLDGPEHGTLIAFDHAEPTDYPHPRQWSDPVPRTWSAPAAVFRRYLGVQTFPDGSRGYGLGPADWMTPQDSITFDHEDRLHAGWHYEYVELTDPAAWGCVPVGGGWWRFTP